MKYKYYIQIVKKKNGTFYWRTKAANGKTIQWSGILKTDPWNVAHRFQKNLSGCRVPVYVEEG